MRICWIFLILFFLSCQSVRQEPTFVEETCSIGESAIRIVLEEWPGSELVFINLHDDENTGVVACRRLIAQRGGRLIELRHGGTRMINFLSEGERFQFDPNRMFTDQGAQRSLEAQGNVSQQALREVREFAAEVLRVCKFEELSMIVTLHNNDNEGYSVASYQGGATYERDALKVHRESKWDPDDFFFVTDGEVFEYFQRRGFNAVLQDNQNVTDDGSLSVLAGSRGIPYINVEAEEGHLEQQLEMLLAVYTIYGN